MKKQIRTWSSLGLAALAGGQAAQAVGPDDIAKGLKAGPPAYMQLADNSGEGGEGGEGEGGHSHAAGELDDAGYLAQLAFIEGHLLVGNALYSQGASEAAAVHMKHPKDEIYASLAPEFDKRGVPGFADELTGLATAVEGKAPASDVDAAFKKVEAGVGKAIGAVKADARTTIGAVVQIMKTAADEFGIGVVDGNIVNVKEYQDAYGFTQVARAMVVDAEAGATPEQKPVFAAILKEIDTLKGAWPDVTGEKPPGAEAKALLVAASKIELASYGLK